MRKVQIDPACFLWWAVLLIALPLRWIIAGFLAAAFHELCHYLAIRLTGGDVGSLRITTGGAVMEAGAMTPGKELFASLAGPMGGLALLAVARWMPLTALCGLVQSIYNLLPLYPLDGGRALHSLARLLTDESKAERWLGYLNRGVTLALTGMVFYAIAVLRLGLWPLILILPIVKEFCQEKYLAKQAVKGYNKGYHI